LQIAPVVVVLPAEQKTATKTPEGRAVAICPATISDDMDCARCGLCAVANRKAIIGFPAHGAAKRKAEQIALAA
jgi:polyferredoxin